ncbi:MAG: mechanosensitive ion channel [Lewinellaceae bacterium]|nr:mechanosensitive ion channel [Lewinellaceae bacterium]
MDLSFPFLSELLKQLAGILPRILVAIVLLFIGLMIARMIGRFLRNLLAKIGIDRFGERLEKIDVVQNSKMEVKLSVFISKIIYYFLLLMVIMVVTEIINIPTITDLIERLINFIPKLVVGIGVLFIGLILADMLRQSLLTVTTSLAIPSAKLISNGIFYFLLINVFVIALKQVEIDTSFLQNNILIVVAGAVFAFALGYGLASKDLVSNFLTSFYLQDQFQIGDEISIGNVRGQIVAMGRSNMTLYTSQGQVFIPIRKLTQEQVTLHKRNQKLIED